MSAPRGVALLVAGALFMEILDATIITPAIPLIARSLDVDPFDVNLAITAYLVTVAVLIPVSGWMSDRFGTRRVFISAIARVHPCLDRVCRQCFAADAGGDARRAGNRRRTDGARRPLAGPPVDREESTSSAPSRCSPGPPLPHPWWHPSSAVRSPPSAPGGGSSS